MELEELYNEYYKLEELQKENYSKEVANMQFEIEKQIEEIICR